MSNLNKDVLFLIFKELQDDGKSFHSCLSINKTCCKIIIPILWKDPWKYLKEGKEISLLNVIISHLSDESKINLSQDFKNSNRKPLFDYISFCRHLNLSKIDRIIDRHIHFDLSRRSFIKNEITNLFINGNTNFTHLYIPRQFESQIHLIPGSKRCFSNLKFLHCNTSINDEVLIGLTEICDFIKELELLIEEFYNNYEIVRLIETPKKLHRIRFQTRHKNIDKSFCKILEGSLIKQSNTVRHFDITNFPSSSLNNLEGTDALFYSATLDHLENVSLPFLQTLRASRFPLKNLTNLIKNTKGHLTEIRIDSYDDLRFIQSRLMDTHNQKLIKAICQNCPNLKYLKIKYRDVDILELEQLLIKCQYLDGLYIYIDNVSYSDLKEIDCDELFKILAKSSPANLFKFKFQYDYEIKLTSFKLFFNNWKGRRPMLLQTVKMRGLATEYFDLIENYEFLGVIKNYYNDEKGNLEDFEWVNSKF